MPYSSIMTFDKEFSELNGLHFCACGEPCTVRIRGTRWGENKWGESKRILCHRWVCEQCYDNLIDDDAKLRILGRQILTDKQWDTWNRWYDKYEGSNEV